MESSISKSVSLLILLMALACGSVWAQNKALSLDGDGDYVEVPEVTFSYEALTLEAWIFPMTPITKPISSAGNTEIIGTAFDPTGDNTEAGIQLEMNPDYIFFDSINVKSRLYSPKVNLFEKWHHISAVYDQVEARIYIDGTKVAERNIDNQKLDIVGAIFRIGCEVDTRGQFWNGVLDEIRIWNVARTEAEIQATMNSALSGKEEGLVGYWNFDDGTAKDLSPNGNDGQFKGDAKTIETVLGGVYTPDPNLRAALEKALGENKGDTITKEDLAGLKELNAEGLSITDISMLKYTTSLAQLNLEDNQITDISPLIENTGISGTIKLKNNPLTNTALSTQIPALEARGITVEYDMPEDVVLFKDSNLEKAIRDTLGIPTELLKKEDLAGLKELVVDNDGNPESKKISDLTGLEHCISLTQLWLGSNQLSNQLNDISSLATLTSPTLLMLDDNQPPSIAQISMRLVNIRRVRVVWSSVRPKGTEFLA